ncbi:MAG: UDP-glucose 4-epimerase GalE [Planctomycetia bacterium]|nr:UDP-glucose 4-epimerase GalE [Planctomycetia bacterium]
MKVLVTGGAGYIGSVVVEKLVAANYDVVVFDNLSQGHRAAVHPKAVLVEGDLSDPEVIDETLEKYEPAAVMHFASYTLVGESVEKPFLYLRENVNNAGNLLECMMNHGIHYFILSSTANLFDEPEKMPISEREKIVPGSPYGESKAMIERMLYWLDRYHGFRYAALRYFNAAGATESYGEAHHPECHLIPLVLQVAQGKREKIKIFGDDYNTPDGTCVRDYIHVADLAQAHILALESLVKKGKSCKYNLGNGQGYSVKQVIETARKITGHAIPAEVVARRGGDPDVLVACSDAIRKDLNWKPEFPELEKIIESAWKWHQAHPSGYQNS